MIKSVFINSIFLAILFSFGAANQDQRIINGKNAVKSEFPWIINMVNSNSSTHRCGGVLINSMWVLTAAHCVTTIRGSEIQLIAGDHNQTDSSEKQRRLVLQIIVHPDYQPNSSLNKSYDFALLRVSAPFQLSDTVKKVNLPLNASVSVSGALTVAGWGITNITNIRNQTSPDILQKVNLTIISSSLCKDLYSSQINITDDMLCAGDDYLSPCNGDSGSGFVQITRDPLSKCKVHVLYGIVSFGNANCAGGRRQPAVFGYVPSVVDWIRQVTGELVTPNPINTTCGIEDTNPNEDDDDNNSNIFNINFCLFLSALGLSFNFQYRL